MGNIYKNVEAKLIELNVGDRLKVTGFVMLKGLDNGRIYKIVSKDDMSYTMQYKTNKKVRHHKYQIHNSMVSNTDLNRIELLTKTK